MVGIQSEDKTSRPMKSNPKSIIAQLVPALAALALLLVPNQAAEAASFATNGPLATARFLHTATLLSNGKVLVVGGFTSTGNVQSSAELYDPITGKWSATSDMTTARYQHTATMLPNGKVLVAGGEDSGLNAVSSAELYDPTTGAWTATGSMTTNHFGHTATLLANGTVLVTGGAGTAGTSIPNSELYNPATGICTPSGNLHVGRYHHTATLLPNGKVLAAGGSAVSGITNSAEVYDPSSGIWTTTASLATARYEHTATLLPNGKVLVAGGEGTSFTALSSAELYDPTAGTWAATGTQVFKRYRLTATLLPSGQVLAAGGIGTSGVATNAAEIYDPTSGTWTATVSMTTARQAHSATLLPSGKVLLATGLAANNIATNSSEIFDSGGGSWAATASMSLARQFHSSTPLPNGKVLIAGGLSTTSVTNRAELYDPTAGTWATTGVMGVPRWEHTATLLPSGKVLIEGGLGTNGALSTAELYDPGTGTWAPTGSMPTTRQGDTATLLTNGKVLAAGDLSRTNSAVYDPASGTWTASGTMTSVRYEAAAVLLPNGKVLVAGGNHNVPLATAEIWDPATGAWTATGNMTSPRYWFTLTLLPNGKVLAVGGQTTSGSTFTNSADLYDPGTGLWTPTGSMAAVRERHKAVLLPNGKVLVTGGTGNTLEPIASAELYDPLTGAWTSAGSMVSPRDEPCATVMSNGKVLVTGGSSNGFNEVNTAELFDVGLGFSAAWQPQIVTITSPVVVGGSLVITGSQFRGISEASGGHGAQDSPCDYPLVQLVSAQSGQAVFLLCTNWSTNTFVSGPVTGLPPGYAQATVFVNGIPSPSKLVLLQSSATVTLGDLLQTYDGTAKSVTAATVPSGLTVDVTYNGSANAPTNAGSYTVIGTISDPTYQGSATNTLLISKAGATVTLGNLSQTYDGTAKHVSVTTAPPGLTVNLTYNGSASAPTNVGSYTVIGTVADPDYQGSATNTLAITKVTGVVILGNLAQIYTGTARNVSVTTVPPGLTVDLSYTGTGFNSPNGPTNVGSYTVVGTINDLNYQGSTNNTLVVSKAAATVTLGNLAQTYTGTARNASITTVPAGLTVNLTYNGLANAPTNVGNYTVIGTVNDLNYLGGATNTLVVSKATATVTLGNLSQAYTGTARNVSVTTAPPGLTVNLTYNGLVNAPTNVGNYTVIGTVADASYQGSATNTLAIIKATATMTLSNLAQTYDGNPKSVTVTTVPPGLTVDVTYNGFAFPPPYVGSYTVIGTVNDPSYQGSATNTLVIRKGTATVTLGNLSQTFDGTAKSVTVTSVPGGLTVFVTYNGSVNAPTNVGSYNVIGTVVDSNYQGGATNTLVISSSSAPPILLTGAAMLVSGAFQFAFTNTPGATFTVFATTDLAVPLAGWTNLGSVTEAPPGHFQFGDPQATNGPHRFYRVRSP